MSVYHVNNKGQTGICKANKEPCRFKDNPHYVSIELDPDLTDKQRYEIVWVKNDLTRAYGSAGEAARKIDADYAFNEYGQFVDVNFKDYRDYTKRKVIMYGSLRAGKGNWRYYVAPHKHSSKTITIPGYTMYGQTGFPYVTKDDTGKNSIVADVVEFEAEGHEWNTVLHELDNLEGYDNPGELNHYDRHVVLIEGENGPEEAYIYLAGGLAADVPSRLPVVEGGDWVEHDKKNERLRLERLAATSVLATGNVQSQFLGESGVAEALAASEEDEFSGDIYADEDIEWVDNTGNWWNNNSNNDGVPDYEPNSSINSSSKHEEL